MKEHFLYVIGLVYLHPPTPYKHLCRMNCLICVFSIYIWTWLWFTNVEVRWCTFTALHTMWTVIYSSSRTSWVWGTVSRQSQLLGLEDVELLLSVSESVSSPLLPAALGPPGLDLDDSLLLGGAEAPLLSCGICPLADAGLLINAGIFCTKGNYCQSQQKSYAITGELIHKVSWRCSARDGTHQCFLSPHQLFNVIAPAEHFSKPPHCDFQVSELHVVPSPQWDLLEGTHSVPVQEETWDSGAHGVHQAGERLDL